MPRSVFGVISGFVKDTAKIAFDAASEVAKNMLTPSDIHVARLYADTGGGFNLVPPSQAKQCIISACFVDSKCRCGEHCAVDPYLTRLVKLGLAIPVCPAESGGLTTPRPFCGIKGGRGEDVWQGRATVVNKEGRNVTNYFKDGALEALKIAENKGITDAILKLDSPSCGLGKTVNCTGTIIKGNGVTAALLLKKGFKVFSEKDFQGDNKPITPENVRQVSFFERYHTRLSTTVDKYLWEDTE